MANVSQNPEGTGFAAPYNAPCFFGMADSSRSRLLDLRFAPELEAAFQYESYQNSRNFLRGASLLSGLMAFGQFVRFLATHQPHIFLLIPTIPMIIWAVGIGLTFLPNFWRYWQPVLLVLLSTAMTAMQIGAAHHIRVEPGYSDLIARVSWFSASTMMFMVTLSAIRLNYRYAATMYTVLSVNCGIICYVLYNAPVGLILDRFSLGIIIEWFVLIYLSYTHERLHREAFLARQDLAAREAAERARRQETETLLHVLSHAIGGIVHDLGNPLTLVQSGLEVLELVISKGDPKPAQLSQVLSGVHSGARMLNYLRISLIEQTRILEGKPIPVSLKPVMIGALVEAGVRYQKPTASNQRRVIFEGESVHLLADEMKAITVFMNLVGNALKYSDGEVRVTWRPDGDFLLVAVQDQGRGGVGLNREQACSLFVAFGRLGAHEAVEGTGLGLLSVQKIVEAHGGQAYIEGRNGEERTHFSTASDSRPPQLDEGFQTAFVVSFPVVGKNG